MKNEENIMLSCILLYGVQIVPGTAVYSSSGTKYHKFFFTGAGWGANTQHIEDVIFLFYMLAKKKSKRRYTRRFGANRTQTK